MEWEDPEGESSAQSAQTQQPAPEQATSTGALSLCTFCAACCQVMRCMGIDQSLCNVCGCDSASNWHSSFGMLGHKMACLSHYLMKSCAHRLHMHAALVMQVSRLLAQLWHEIDGGHLLSVSHHLAQRDGFSSNKC